MFELTINNVVYQFRFGLGFVREINKKVTKTDGNNAKQELGLQYAVAGLLDEDPLTLVDILDVANKTEKPRVSRNMLDAYIEDECTDISALFADVLDFFGKSNATRKMTEAVKQMVEAEKAKQAQQ